MKKIDVRDLNHKAVVEYLAGCDILARRFCDYMDWEWSDYNFQVAGTADIWNLSDYFVSMHDMCTVLWIGISPKEFMEWYDLYTGEETKDGDRVGFTLWMENKYGRKLRTYE